MLNMVLEIKVYLIVSCVWKKTIQVISWPNFCSVFLNDLVELLFPVKASISVQ